MKLVFFLRVCIGLVATATCLAQNTITEQASQLELQGRFKEAAIVLTNAFASTSLSPTDRKQLEFELDRLERIRKDFRLRKEALFAQVQAAIKDVTVAEFDRWVAAGWFDSREIDGERRFMHSGARNIFFIHPELNSRRVKPKHSGPHDKAVLAACQAIQKAALGEKQPYVLPKRFRVTFTVTAKADAAPDGQIIRAWLPIPREYPFQKDFELRTTSPMAKRINPPACSIRAAYFEQCARAGKATKFKIEYDYTTYGVKFDVKLESVHSCDPNDPALAPFLRETTHVEFTPEMRALSADIVGTETNAFRKAKKCFDWIADQIKYSYAIEYSTIRNISEYCRTKRYGDCGQEALLFITLCRLNGIPARWQSGWNVFPNDEDIHDWTEIYLSPYGWMPVDPYMGIWAMQMASTLKSEQRRYVRDFYFGGLDQWRMIANSDHCQELSPPKNSFRSDNVDFQRGELEWGNHNLYFDQYSYAWTVKEVKLRN